MTQAQETAIRQIQEIMREHFDAGIVILQGEAQTDEDTTQEQADKSTSIQYLFHGGYATAIGLVELAKIHVWKRGADESEGVE